MEIQCKKCGTNFEFSVNELSDSNLKFKCSVCGHIWKADKSLISKSSFNTIPPRYKLLIALNVIIITIVVIVFFLFRDNLEFIDEYWRGIYTFFDNLIPIQ